jgi:hypothetical protein
MFSIYNNQFIVAIYVLTGFLSLLYLWWYKNQVSQPNDPHSVATDYQQRNKGVLNEGKARSI